MKTRFLMIACMLLLYAAKSSAQVSFTDRPNSMQLYPRQAGDSASVIISGKVMVTGYSKAIFTMHKNGALTDSTVSGLTYSGGKASFSRTYRIHAEKSLYRFKMYIYNGTASEMLRADSVCSGDVFLVNGQSNAVALANVLVSDTANVWVRSFGSKSPVTSETQADTAWGIANAGTGTHHCGIGVWAYRLGRIIADSTNIPVSFINGAKIGSRIVDHLPASDHADINTNYGKLIYRVNKAKVKDAVKGMFWYQGESDADTAYLQYSKRFNLLYTAWRQDFPSLTKVVVMQLRPGCMTGTNMIYHQQLREIQRGFASRYNDVLLMTTTAIPNYDGCHFTVNGYYQLGQQLYSALCNSLYNKPAVTGGNAPRLLQARYSNNTNTEVALIFDQPLIFPSIFNGYNIKDYFYLNSNVTISNGLVSGDTVKLQVSASSNADKISYLPGIYYNGTTTTYQGPWLVNSKNVGAPSFYQISIVNSLVISGSLCSVGSIQLATTRAGQNYQWYNNGVLISGANASQFTATTDGIYTLVMSDANSMSITSNAIKITGGKIIPVITTPTGFFTYCSGSSVGLTSNIPAATYQWYKSGVALPNANGVVYAASANGSYSVTIQDGNGCSSSSSAVNVTTAVNPSASFTITNQFNVCQDSMVTLTANSGSGLAYQWQKSSIDIPGGTTQVFNTVHKGVYRVIVTNSIGCTRAAAAKVIPVVNPAASITAPVTAICPGAVATLTANSGTGYTYQWFKNNALIAGYSQQTYDATVAASYGVRVTNSMGCSTNSPAKIITEKTDCNPRMQSAHLINNISVLVYPNPFSSFFTLRFPSCNFISSFNFEVMNEQMQKVMEIKNVSGFPGEEKQVNAGKLASGIYIYRLYNDEELFTGKIIKQ